MPLTPVADIIRHAIDHQYAVGYFESWSLDSLQGVIDAAERSRSPVIIGFNGEFLSLPDRIAAERLAWYGVLGRTAAESSTIPCGFIFNECPVDSWVRAAITAGFNLVMPVPAKGEGGNAYAERVQALTTLAHAHGVAVEAELGTLPYGGGDRGGSGSVTDPVQARAFVAATGIDLLAVSVGNVHVLLNGRRALNLEHLKALRRAVAIPFVLHGGTGIDDESLKAAIQLGAAKVNYGTALKQRYLSAVRGALANPDPDPHHLLGYGGTADVMVAGRLAVRDAVLEKMAILGCIGRA